MNHIIQAPAVYMIMAATSTYRKKYYRPSVASSRVGGTELAVCNQSLPWASCSWLSSTAAAMVPRHLLKENVIARHESESRNELTKYRKQTLIALIVVGLLFCWSDLSLVASTPWLGFASGAGCLSATANYRR